MWASVLRGLGPRFRVMVGCSTCYLAHQWTSGPTYCAPQRRSAGPAPAASLARTSFTLVPGNPSQKVEDHFALAQDSPLVHPFLSLIGKLMPAHLHPLPFQDRGLCLA